MNLVSLELEDYRQFAGLHRFTPAQQSMAAIIGPNGAGKTTLFEAIEWCLYNPSYIRNDDIRPRILGGKPRVKVVLEDPHSGEGWEIERELGMKSVTASVYRSSQPDSPVVQGTKQVTDYVAKSLLGLSQQAFVATFFTRQKELTFFGSLSTAERRREVGKLLGLETIRVAQKSIGDQRQLKILEATSRKRLHDDQAQGRDFPSERQAAAERVTVAQRAVEALKLRHTTVSAELESAVAVTQAEEERSDRFNALRLEEAGQAGGLQGLSAQIEAARASLAEIDHAGEQIEILRPQAAEREALQNAIDDHERQRQAAERAEELKGLLTVHDQNAQSILESITAVRARIEPATARSIEEGKEFDPPAEIDRLIEAASAVRSSLLQENLNELERCLSLSVSMDAQRLRLGKFEREVANIEIAIETLAAEEPARVVEQAEHALTQARGERSAALATAETMTKQRDTLKSLRQRLISGRFDEPCPTCGRPYLAEDLDRDAAALQTQVDDLDEQITVTNALAADAGSRASSAATLKEAAGRRLSELEGLRSRLASSEEPVAEARNDLERMNAEYEGSLKALHRTNPPQESELVESRTALKVAQDREREVPLLLQMRKDYESNRHEHQQVGLALASLGPVAYDAAKHRDDIEVWRIASDAASRIEVLKQRIDSRPQVEAALAAALGNARSIEAQLSTIRASIDLLAFEPDALTAARAGQQTLQTAREAGLAELSSAQRDLDGAERFLTAIDQEERRLQKLLTESIEAQRQADEFHRMYQEFSRFEQFVALSVTPAIADITSQLVASVTDGKYDRVEFTEDFGIVIYDGADDAFPLQQFSGGERDVIALCARLALSQFIGGQSAAPPQFVVLDEVFGSLDRQRRENLMDTLQKLIAESGVFRQLFVISHVDDVQASAAFDEVWRVRETADGSSQLEQLTGISAPEEM